jgi:hypothetical protein
MKQIAELAQLMVISTAHITPKDDYYLTTADSRNLGGGAWSEKLSVGYLLIIEEEHDPDESAQYASEALTDIITFARKQNITYVRLDPDGPVQYGLKTYTW